MVGFLTLVAFVFLAFVGFVIYFIFKQMQFVIQAVDLYKSIVVRLDKIISILSPNSELAIDNAVSLPPADVASPAPPELSREELMQQHGIRYENGMYSIDEYDYDTLKEAVEHRSK